MKVKLKTWKQFEKEFGPKADKWEKFKYCDGTKVTRITIANNGTWVIFPEMKELFGKEIEVERLRDDSCYSHVGVNWAWHEDWFKKDSFLKLLINKVKKKFCS